MSQYLDAAGTPQPSSACRTRRLQRSTWHQLLAAVEARRGSARGLADLLGAPEAHVQAWREAAEAMPTGSQRRLAMLAEARFADDRVIHRLASIVLGQIEAREALDARGPVHIMAVPGNYR